MRLDEMLGHPQTCPHGNPIDVAVAKKRPPGVPLASLSSGDHATIYRITEEAEEDAPKRGWFSRLQSALYMDVGDRDPFPPSATARPGMPLAPAVPGA